MCQRPLSCETLPVRQSRWLPPKGYTAINFFGSMLMRREHYQDWQQHQEDSCNKMLMNHERIHLRQAASVHNSWLCYYAVYVWFFIRNNPLRYGVIMAYQTNPFELEAYLFEHDFAYAQGAELATRWRDLSAFPPAFWRSLYSDTSQSSLLPPTKDNQKHFLERVRRFMDNRW